MTRRAITGGCLCGAVRYTASAPPRFAGYCCCVDCRRASGSGFVPFMGFAADTLSITGPTQRFAIPSLRGSDAVRNSCPTCHSLIFGGIYGQDSQHTIYAGSLDDPTHFHPTIAIFNAHRPNWVSLPDGLKLFDFMPE
jgi:hypothetical protein